jgi:hypothetical protein
MSRSGKSKSRYLPLFSPESETICRIVRRVSPDEAEKYIALGAWEQRYDTYSGELMGYRLKALVRDDSEVLSAGHTPAAISFKEMQTNCEYSHTSGLPEFERLRREKNGQPAEDHVERVQCKVIVYAHVGHAKRDILRVWPQ